MIDENDTYRIKAIIAEEVPKVCDPLYRRKEDCDDTIGEIKSKQAKNEKKNEIVAHDVKAIKWAIITALGCLISYFIPNMLKLI